MKILYVYYRLQLRNACHESGVDFIFLYFIYSFFMWLSTNSITDLSLKIRKNKFDEIRLYNIELNTLMLYTILFIFSLTLTRESKR